MIQQIISDSPWHPGYFFSCPTWQVKKDQRVVAMLGTWEVWTVWTKGACWQSGMWYLYRGWGQSNILWRALGLWALQATRGRARARRGGCLPISLIHRDLPSWGNLKFPEGSGDQRLIPYRKSWFAWEALQVGEGGLSVLPTLVRCSYVWKVVLSSHWRGLVGLVIVVHLDGTIEHFDGSNGWCKGHVPDGTILTQSHRALKAVSDASSL